jgi:hypothetical protein
MLRFERGSGDVPACEVTSQWFQITYDFIRDENDTEIANFDGAYWHYNGTRYSDIVIYATALPEER